MLAGIRDVENFFVGRKRDAVGSRQIFDNELNFRVIGRRTGFLLDCIDNAKHAVEFLFFRWIVVALGSQSIGWIGEIERAVRFVDEIVGAVELFAVVSIGKDCNLSFRVERLETPYVAARVTGNRDTALWVDRHSVRAGLGTVVRIGAFVAARMRSE